ncbi:hypothetical protein Adt_45702 [Abeliophyllum distichum]|uniref:Uncharacterized protein n=1 Tax=Abeliophyllum distichum TaxID=126358 RepID=A0ABD1PEJ4_9LAMI
MEMLPAHPMIVAVNLAREFVQDKELFSAFESFVAEEAKSNKLSEDLKAMGLEKAQLESEKRALQFKLDFVVTKEADMKAKYEIELKVAKECLKQARDQRRATEASQKYAEEAQKLVDDRTLVAETTLATANSSLEVVVADKEKSLTVAKLELDRVREAYQDAFVDTPEYQDLTQRLMTIGGEQLVERIMETHPEWDISFLCEASTEASTSEAVPGNNCDRDEGQATPLVTEKGPSFADP